MKLNGRRESTNVEDRRGMSSGMKIAGGGGLLAVIVGIIMTLMNGGSLTDVIQNSPMIQPQQTEQTQQGTYQGTPEEEELAAFSKKILAGTEDVWTEEFRKMGLTYEAPKLVLYTGSTPSGCGTGQANMGPFYCSADQCVYIDLSFFLNMKKTLGADGDFAYAYVIAHEVGHHVQYLLGTLGDYHNKRATMNERDGNQLNVRLELQADYYAGVWAYHDNEMFGSLEPGDIEKAVDCAGKIGDDYLQKKAQGYAVEDSFTHGRSDQRARWLSQGIKTGDVKAAQQIFTMPYSRL